MMTRKIFFAVLSFMILASSTCSAKISSNRFFLGGLTLEKPMSEAFAMYGAASKVEENGRLTLHYYGDGSFCIVELAGRIFSIHTNANNEIATPDGVTVGMAEQVVLDVYGKADSINQQEDGLKNYIYNIAGRVRDFEELRFSVRNGKVVGISLRYDI